MSTQYDAVLKQHHSDLATFAQVDDGTTEPLPLGDELLSYMRRFAAESDSLNGVLWHAFSIGFAAKSSGLEWRDILQTKEDA